MVLLLDALNEMPAASERDYRERVGLWKDWLTRLVREQPGNRVVFSCRSLDYSAPLSTPALRVPQVQIEALTDTQVESFLKAYSPVRGVEIWAAIKGTPQLEALRAPFFLALVVEQVEATGDLAEDRAGIFTGFVRQALRREVERDNPLFALEELLSSRDLRRITQWQWKDGYELPERGALFPKLGVLAYGMQEAAADGGARADWRRYARTVHWCRRWPPSPAWHAGYVWEPAFLPCPASPDILRLWRRRAPSGPGRAANAEPLCRRPRR